MKRALLAATAAVSLLAACSGDDDGADLDVDTAAARSVAATTPTTEATIPEVTDEASTTTGSTARSTTTSVAAAPQATPIATWEGDPPFTDIGDNPVHLRVELLELSRDADVVTLRWTLTHVGGDDGFSASVNFGESGGGADNVDTTRGISLLDLTNGNRYLTLLDDADDCLCSDIATPIQPDQRVELSAQFPAPPPEVGTVSVVIPGIPPFERVPITQGG
jgi:hypothetical protein